MNKRCVALLGRRDEPTDAVEDYCRYLGAALEKHGVSLELMRMEWAEKGWRAALQEIHKKADAHRGSWFLVQYTALAWSQRGFPLRVVKLLRSLKERGLRCGVVFHDGGPYGGNRMVDRVRRTLQTYTMRKALRLAELAVLTIPREKAPWVSSSPSNIVFIPVGANLPSPERAWLAKKNKEGGAATLCVFSLSPGAAGRQEVEWIDLIVRYAARKLGSLRLVVVGRNSVEGGQALKSRLNGTPVQVVVHGLLTGEELVPVLGASHAMLFARGQISSRRGSAIAGIACGLPIVAPEGSETAPPITEAGVVLLPGGAWDAFSSALAHVLSDDVYRESLAQRSRCAHERYFSWKAISAQYVQSLYEARQNHRGM